MSEVENDTVGGAAQAGGAMAESMAAVNAIAATEMIKGHVSVCLDLNMMRGMVRACAAKKTFY